MSASQKISAALTSLILEQPFYGALALSLPLKADPTCKTAWTDGRNIGYNPAFIDSLSHDRITGLIAHEVSHVALGHPWRREARDPKGWNVATDRIINHDLREAGFRLPDGVLYASGDEIGKSAEWVYARLDEGEGDAPQQGIGQQESSGNESQDDEDSAPGDGESDEDADSEDGEGEGDGKGKGDGQPGDSDGDEESDEPGDPMGEVRDAPTEEDEEGNPAPTEQDWKQKTAAAAQIAKAMGNMPGGMARDVAEALKPKIDVRSLLLRFFSERSKGDYSWMRPNVRYVNRGLYLPALESKSLGRVGILTDTSGSIDGTALQFARGIVESVIEECSPLGVVNVYADAAVKKVDRFEQGDPLTWEPQGGGGTDFRPALKFFEDEGEATCIVAITDLEGTFPEVPPDIPVLWLAIPGWRKGLNDTVAPFGETVPVQY